MKKIKCDNKNCFFAQKDALENENCADCTHNKLAKNPIKDYSKSLQESGY